MVYVLTTLMKSSAGTEWRPVAVIDNENIAEQWVAASNNNDWIPLEMNDLSLTGLADGMPTTFTPKTDQQLDNDNEKMLRETNDKLRKLVEQLQKSKSTKPKAKAKTTSLKSPLFQKGS